VTLNYRVAHWEGPGGFRRVPRRTASYSGLVDLLIHFLRGRLHSGQFAEGQRPKAELDRAAPDHPVSDSVRMAAFESTAGLAIGEKGLGTGSAVKVWRVRIGSEPQMGASVCSLLRDVEREARPWDVGQNTVW